LIIRIRKDKILSQPQFYYHRKQSNPFLVRPEPTIAKINGRPPRLPANAAAATRSFLLGQAETWLHDGLHDWWIHWSRHWLGGHNQVVSFSLSLIINNYIYRAGLRGREALRQIGKTAAQMGGSFGVFMTVAQGIRC
jgi:hypothetical protein